MFKSKHGGRSRKRPAAFVFASSAWGRVVTMVQRWAIWPAEKNGFEQAGAMMNISLPVAIEKWAAKQANEKGYDTTDKFVLDLLRREKALEARERIDDILTKAMSSGKPTPMTRADWDRIRTNGRRLARERRKK